MPPTSAGLVNAGLGERSATTDALGRACAARDVRMTLVRADGRWKLVRDDPRYIALMQRMKLG